MSLSTNSNMKKHDIHFLAGTMKTKEVIPFFSLFSASRLRKIGEELLILIFLFATLTTKAQNTFNGVNGEVWKDTQGIPIQAHGGQVQKIGDKWWWIGENRNGNRNICLYSSDDLFSWKNEGYAMRTVDTRGQLDTDAYFTALYGQLTSAQKDDVFTGIQSTKVIERPKLLYNKKTGKYIIWFHADDSNYGAAMAGIAISNTITGPYTFIKRSRLHQLPDNKYDNQKYEAAGYRGFARDMNLFVDDDGKAYILYSSENNYTMFISRLNDDYTDLDVSQTPVGLAKNGVDFIRLFPGALREAPAMFKYFGKYYLITSGTSGWNPNASRYWSANEIFGAWKDMGDFCISEPNIPYAANLTFKSQSTSVIPIDPVNGKFIYMGDRWNSSNLSDSRYIWLPIYLSPNGGIELRSITSWNLSLFDSINNARFDLSPFNRVFFHDSDLPKDIDVQVRTANGWENSKIMLSWNKVIADLSPASLTKFSSDFLFNGTSQTVSSLAVNIPQGLLYYIDCGASSGSQLFDSIKSKLLAPHLINKTTYDQAFNLTSGWGYTGIIGSDINSKYPDSKDAFTSGWWAYSAKPIDYKLRVVNDDYRLTVGFQEWWNTSRSMKISLLYQNNQGNSITRDLGTFVNSTQSTQDYTFRLNDLNPQNPYITVRVVKTGNPDPVLSWLALTSLSLNEVTGIYNPVSKSSGTLNVYPNPVVRNQTVYVETNIDEKVGYDTDICIYTLSGQFAYKQKITGKRTAIDISLPSGIYIISCKNSDSKLIIK